MSNSLPPMDCSTPGFPVLHCLLEFAQSLPMVGAPQRNNIIYNIYVLEQLVWGQVEEIHIYFHWIFSYCAQFSLTVLNHSPIQEFWGSEGCHSLYSQSLLIIKSRSNLQNIMKLPINFLKKDMVRMHGVCLETLIQVDSVLQAATKCLHVIYSVLGTSDTSGKN